MTGKVKVNLFLTDSEKETLLDLHDMVSVVEPEREQDFRTKDKILNVISRIVFGKVIDGKVRYPLMVRFEDQDK